MPVCYLNLASICRAPHIHPPLHSSESLLPTELTKPKFSEQGNAAESSRDPDDNATASTPLLPSFAGDKKLLSKYVKHFYASTKAIAIEVAC